MTEEHRRMPSFADEDLVDLRSYRTVDEEAEESNLLLAKLRFTFSKRFTAAFASQWPDA